MRLPNVRLPRPSAKKLVVLGTVGLALAGGAFAAYSFTSKHNTPLASAEPVTRPARVAEISYRTQGQTLLLAGTVVPRIESTLGFRVSGKITQRSVDVGAVVKPGDVIAALDPSDYQLAVDNARAALASAEADHVRAKADHERYLNLRGSMAFVPQTLDQRQSLASTALARVDQAKSQLSSAENNLAYTVLRADAAGVVTAVQAEVGQVMAQGQGVIRLARTDELEILVGVPEHRLKAVREAQGASFELWSDPGRRHAAKLRELSPSADPVTRTYAARFSVLEPPQFIGLGMTATLGFERPDRTPVAEVPLSAIFQRGTQPAVWVVDRDSGTVELRAVTIARWRDDTAAILSGVKEGELIATAGVHKLETGQKVKPLQSQQQAAR
ncbi:MAG: efflux RND transporter periplasmic adaptor subunit [Reyranella sp.]|uniref:efflux RND transporter periplasmic adaptor subunit n=1 Tax=Reyranella sp. TaxID=1929291 RepID=UPI00121DFF7A|nr:efflux RND transporter periplasmic adaptor subunit [Reyranella sp.]TAJ86830.1 MAG: efflux RND transporter periplasmic adaptor subunit [Reyranella sp.]TBR28914.1 MAG: efflux RND transporter periplasmic adaptor subunit [Reyranella sp.]